MTIPIHDLAAPFPPDQVKQRRGNFGQTLDYVETATVIARLNEALDGQWSFTIQSMDIEPEHVIVRGRLTIGDTHREQYGGSKITRHRDTGEVLNIADDLKSAASDALKKCATLAGVGLYLYGDAGNGNGGHHNNDRTSSGASRANGHANGSGRGNGQRSNSGRTTSTPTSGYRRDNAPTEDDPRANARVESPRVSNDQIARIVQTAKDVGMPQKDLIALSRDAFGAVLSQLTPDQADDLISLIGAAA